MYKKYIRNNSVGNSSDYSELKRKIVHMGTILYPICYNILPRSTAILIAGIFVLLDIIIETIRLTFKPVNKFILKYAAAGMYRKHEENNISTLIWTLSGGFLTMFMFQDSKVITTALLFMVFGDSAAGLIGTHHGKTKILNKSVEGSLACFIVCFICAIFFFPWQIALIAAVVATIIEFLPLPFSDNFWLPVLSGFTLQFLTKLFNT